MITQHLTGCPSAEEILAYVCKALSDSQGSFRPSLSEVEALLGNDWGQPLYVTVCRSNDLGLRGAILETSRPRAMSQIVLRLWWITGGLPKSLLVRIGTKWVWRGLYGTHCGMPHVLVHNAESSWLYHGRTLEASSIDMCFAPPLIVA